MCEIEAFCLTCGEYKKVEKIQIIPSENYFGYYLECDHTIDIKGLKYNISYIRGSEKLEGKKKLPPKWKREICKEISFDD